MEAWSGLELTCVADDGNLTQLYPTTCSAGTNPATAVTADLIRQPTEGKLLSIQVMSDGTNGGVIELWDVNGADAGADVSSSNVITDTQLQSLITRGLAKLLYRQNFDGEPTNPFPNVGPRTFLHGIAARMWSETPTGTCELNLVCTGGYRKTEKI